MAKITQTAGRNALGTFAPEFAHFNDDVLFGENWNNEDIDLKTRSIITVVALMAQGITDSSLKFHLQNAKDHGVTQKEIAAIITHVAFYAGWPKGWAVFNLAKEVWNEEEIEKLLVRKDSHKAQMCMPLKPATTRDCGEGVQFNAATTGTSTMPPRAADSCCCVPPARAGIRRRASPLFPSMRAAW